MSDFKSLFLEHTKQYESPGSFWKWSSYVAISAVLRDNVYLPEGDSRLYPNIFVLSLATSSVHRKGRPVQLCQSLVNSVGNTTVISGRTSVQAILDELQRTETDKKTGQIKKGGTGVFFAKELAAGIVSDPAAVQILTDIYDYDPNPYKHALRHGPKFQIDRIVLTMFAASNEAMLDGVFTQAAVKGGLLARTFLVIPNEFRSANSLFDLDQQTTVESFKKCLDALREISALSGTFRMTKLAADEYDNWYKPFRDSYKSRNDGAGVVGRIHTSVLKLALIMAANDRTLVVEKKHVEESINECIGLIPNYNQFIMSTGKSSLKDAGAIFLTTLYEAKDFQLDRKIILRQNWSNFDAETLDKLVVTFEQANIITTKILGNSTIYMLTDVGIKMLKGGA